MHSMYQIITNQFFSGQVQFLFGKILWTTSLKFLGITRLDMIQQSKIIQEKTITLGTSYPTDRLVYIFWAPKKQNL